MLALDIKDSIALKAMVALSANLAAVAIFCAYTSVPLVPVLALSASSVLGGLLGARVTRRLPDSALRAVTVCVGLVAAGYALVR